WKTIKEDPENVKVVMHLLMQYVFVLSVVTRPFLPYTSDRIRRLLALEPLKENGELLELSNTLSEGENLLKSGHKISSPEHLFTRVEDSVVDTQVAKLQATKSEFSSEQLPQNNNLKDTIQYDDFIKMDLRAATIMDAKKVEKADKLLQLTLDVGFEKRTVVSGIAQHFAPDQIIGQKVTLLANLAPRKIRGVESKGMILMSENEDGSLKFVQPAVEAENGASIS
ncbi:MAG: methionine--tRNA ligase subunit beta, partial [Saprospiraceae bacterium]|nr:methionine--tRNA ligase subunit beta [Saprospiraceae bacterium]